MGTILLKPNGLQDGSHELRLFKVTPDNEGSSIVREYRLNSLQNPELSGHGFAELTNQIGTNRVCLPVLVPGERVGFDYSKGSGTFFSDRDVPDALEGMLGNLTPTSCLLPGHSDIDLLNVHHLDWSLPLGIIRKNMRIVAFHREENSTAEILRKVKEEFSAHGFEFEVNIYSIDDTDQKIADALAKLKDKFTGHTLVLLNNDLANICFALEGRIRSLKQKADMGATLTSIDEVKEELLAQERLGPISTVLLQHYSSPDVHVVSSQGVVYEAMRNWNSRILKHNRDEVSAIGESDSSYLGWALEKIQKHSLTSVDEIIIFEPFLCDHGSEFPSESEASGFYRKIAIEKGCHRVTVCKSQEECWKSFVRVAEDHSHALFVFDRHFGRYFFRSVWGENATGDTKDKCNFTPPNPELTGKLEQAAPWLHANTGLLLLPFGESEVGARTESGLLGPFEFKDHLQNVPFPFDIVVSDIIDEAATSFLKNARDGRIQF